MKRLLCVVTAASALLLFASSPAAPAQSGHPTPKLTKCPTTTTLQDLTRALDADVSGPANRDRSCMRELMMPDARMTPVLKAKDGAITPHTVTLDGWIEAVAKRGSTPFYERQIKVTAQTYGHIAHLWSTYEIRDTPDGKAKLRGINSIEAFKDGNHWRILNIQWQAETPEEKIPAKDLP
ncbi:hypothetical protein [Acidicapsa ligni]|uniref:hypothetical protein n=1 Tax=Acidicapsa ligni TaxID=542300 RepID=UPI0021DF5F3C|nr:hypothetical protein [Acidicapsa ligni]